MRAVTAGAVPDDAADGTLDGAPATRVRGYWRSVLRRLGRDWVTLGFGAVVLAILLLVQPAGRTAPIWAYLMRQGASLSWST